MPNLGLTLTNIDKNPVRTGKHLSAVADGSYQSQAAVALGWTIDNGFVNVWLSPVTFQVGVPKFPDSCPRIRFSQLLRQLVHFTERFLHPLFRILSLLSFGLRHHMPRLIALK